MGDKLPIVSMTEPMDDFVAAHPEVKIGYVHGEEPVEDAVKTGKATGLLLPKLDKSRSRDRPRHWHAAAQGLQHGRGQREALLHRGTQHPAVRAFCGGRSATNFSSSRHASTFVFLRFE